jgi:hypothetical protein
VSENCSRNSERTVAITADDARRTMRGFIRDCAQPITAGERDKVWLSRVADLVGITFNRLYDIYNGEAVPRWHEGETLRLRAEERRRMQDTWGDIKARAELAEVIARLERLEGNVSTRIERRAVASESTDCDRQAPLDLG